MDSTNPPLRPYFRRDQSAGITAPDLTKLCTYAEHIVHARGKRTQYTSVSRDANKLRDFDGDTLYELIRDRLNEDGHQLVEHEALVDELRRISREGEKADRARAIRALDYARRRSEGLIDWRLDISGIDRKNVITWAGGRVAVYFKRIGS